MQRISIKKLDNTFKFYKIIKKYKSATENYCKSSLIYNAKRSFYKYYRDNYNLSFKSEHCLLAEFFNGSNTFNKLKTQKEKTKKEKHKCVCHSFRII